ncbi:protein NDUFAF4 homolog [Musca vetustissima]|uniref:protein NDUFAF4 homolog n=1 Tax=Musca vetustissima TaxID=27455 RepID=UPI002AB6024A|nr:protein NDUFAF4 homolog [Musca vetustissima]
MGKVMSIVSRQINRFNVENRAHRVLERDKPVPAPKYESNIRDMERTMELDPKFLERLNKKDEALDQRLKSVYVTSEDKFIDYGIKRKEAGDDKSLPLDRRTPEDFEFGYKEPHRVAPGRCTLRQALKFITDHQAEPEKWTAAKIADEYKLKPELTENILKYFRSYSIYIPDIKQKESILTQTKRKLLSDSSNKIKDE